MITASPTRERIRAAAVGQLTGVSPQKVLIPVYKVPIGYLLEVRRIVVDINSIGELNQHLTVPLAGIAGCSARYYRSGMPVEWSYTRGTVTTSAIPGTQTWGEQQGPRLTSGETFEYGISIDTTVLPVALNGVVTVNLEGILLDAESLK